MSAGSAFYCYDANGNMTQKIDGSTTSYTYDAENRMTAVSGAATATFVYDGDGNRVKGVVSGVTTTYIGNYFEWSGSTGTMKKYYYAGGTRVAERVGSSSLYWLLSDHLGSTSITATSSGSIVGELRYKPWGETRYTYGSTPTTIRYTGQREESSLGLYWYASRWYSPYLNRFLSPDSIIPAPYDPQFWDRYSYVRNNPANRVDPDGHAEKDPDGGCGLKSCIYSFQQDLLASKIFKGSNDDGSWNWKDRYFFSNNRDAIWRDPSKWLNSDPEGWEGFVVRVERLSSHYTEKEKNKFLRDFSLVWGGIPNDTNFITAGLSVGHGPHEIQPLNESNTGLRSDLLDINGATDNQSHHYVGLFFLGYYISPDIARAISYVRDHDNLGDIALGEMAIQDGHNFHRNGTYDDLVSQIRDLLGQ